MATGPQEDVPTRAAVASGALLLVSDLAAGSEELEPLLMRCADLLTVPAEELGTLEQTAELPAVAFVPIGLACADARKPLIASLAESGVMIVAYGREAAPTLLPKAFRAGICDFISVPIAEPVLRRKVELLQELRSRRHEGSDAGASVLVPALEAEPSRQSAGFEDAEQARENERSDRVATALMIAQINLALTAEATLRKLLQQCTEIIVEEGGIAFSRIWLYDEFDQMLSLQASAGLHRNIDGAHSQLLLGSCKVGLVALTKQPQFSNSLRGDSEVTNQRWLQENGLVAFAGYPLLVDERLIGVLGVFSTRPLNLTFLEALKAAGDAIASGIARKQREQELHRQREWLQVTLAGIGDGVVTTDTEGRITFINPVAEELSGWPLKEALGRQVRDVLRVADEATGAMRENPIEIALREARRIDVVGQSILLAKSGREVPIEDNAAPIKDSFGVVIGAVMVFHDVTQRRRAEQAIRQSEERFRVLSEVVPQLVWSTLPNGEADYFNSRWVEYTGRTVEQSLGWGWTNVIHRDDAAATVQAWKEAVAEGSDYEGQYRARGKDGSYRWFLARAIAMRGTGGEIARWFGTCTDIHESKVAAHALHAQAQITESLYEIASTIAAEFDLETVVQKITDAATRLTAAQFGAFFYNTVTPDGESYTLYTLSGVSKEAFADFPMPRATELFGPTFRGEGIIRSDNITRDERHGSAPHRGMSQEHLPVKSYMAVPVISRAGEVLGGLLFGHADEAVFGEREEKIVAGIAAQAAVAIDNARLFQAAETARREAEKANQAKDQFLAALSHELRTPLTPVLVTVESLLADEMVAGELAGDLEMILRNVQLEARLIDDLLDLTRIARGKLELSVSEADVNATLEHAISTCRPEAEVKGLKFVLELASEKRTAECDAARLTQVYWNVLKNAVKFTPAGGRITVRSYFTEVGAEPVFVVEVSDTGVGIEPGAEQRIFNAFEQGGRGITRVFGGLGLGLAISKAILELHRGAIFASSGGRDKGAKFTTVLPLRFSSGTTERAITVAVPRAGGDLGPAAGKRGPVRVLVVEDHVDTAAVLKRMLSRAGYQVTLAHSVAEAMAAARASFESSTRGGMQPVDVVVSDLGLPDGSGLEMMRTLAQRYGLRGVALSGYGMEQDLENSAAAGFDRHLTKPVEFEEIRAAIEAVCRRTG